MGGLEMSNGDQRQRRGRAHAGPARLGELAEHAAQPGAFALTIVRQGPERAIRVVVLIVLLRLSIVGDISVRSQAAGKRAGRTSGSRFLSLNESPGRIEIGRAHV